MIYPKLNFNVIFTAKTRQDFLELPR